MRVGTRRHTVRLRDTDSAANSAQFLDLLADIIFMLVWYTRLAKAEERGPLLVLSCFYALNLSIDNHCVS